MHAIESEWISNHGIYVNLASEKLKEILGIKYCILMNNGTSATQCLFKAIKYKHPHIQKIYVPNSVFVAPWNCALMEYPHEAIEVLRLDEHTLNMDTNEDYIRSLEPNSAVCIVHNYGNIINVPRLKRIRPDLIFVEDNCEGLFGKYEGKYSGTASLCSAVSFYGNKTITTGEGGAFFTNDPELHAYIANIYSHGMSAKRYVHCNLGTNYRMTNVQAAFLYDQLKDIEHILELKKKVFEHYDTLLQDLLLDGKIVKFKKETDTEISRWMYCCLMPKTTFQTIEAFLKDKMVEIRPFFYDIHTHSHLQTIKNPHDSTFAKHVTDIGVMLPSFPELTFEEQQYICNMIKEFWLLQEPSRERQIARWSKLEQPSYTTLQCGLCQSNQAIEKYEVFKAKDIFNAGTLVRYKCPECEVIFGDLRFLNLPQEEINCDYEDLYSYYDEGNTTPYILEVLQDQPFFGDKTKTYIDYACGRWNKVIQNLRNEGYTAIGYDKYVTDNSNAIINTLPSEKCDILINSNYIEHFIHPLEDIQEMLQFVKPGGYILFMTECFEYKIEFTHYHTFFFGKKALEFIAKECNLEFISSKDYSFADDEKTTAKLFRKL